MKFLNSWDCPSNFMNCLIISKDYNKKIMFSSYYNQAIMKEEIVKITIATIRETQLVLIRMVNTHQNQILMLTLLQDSPPLLRPQKGDKPFLISLVRLNKFQQFKNKKKEVKKDITQNDFLKYFPSLKTRPLPQKSTVQTTTKCSV